MSRSLRMLPLLFDVASRSLKWFLPVTSASVYDPGGPLHDAGLHLRSIGYLQMAWHLAEKQPKPRLHRNSIDAAPESPDTLGLIYERQLICFAAGIRAGARLSNHIDSSIAERR
jgi:hypothetical protein